MAAALLDLGVVPGDRVALLMGNCPEWVSIYYACSRVGAVVVPMNPKLAPPEVFYILHHCRPKILWLDRSWMETLAPDSDSLRQTVERVIVCSPGTISGSCDGFLVHDEILPEEPDLDELDRISREIDLEDDHSICYTAGTTGHPKGAVLTHCNILMSQFYLLSLEYQLSRDDVFLISTPFCHRTGWGRVILSIGLGAKLVVMEKFDPVGMLEEIARHRVSVIGIVPTVLKRLLNLPDFEQYDRSSVRVLLLTGEACRPSDLQELRRGFPNALVHGFLSSTEAGTISNLKPEDQASKPESVGRPIPGVQVRIVDDQGQDLPIGGVGEIWVHSGRRGTYTMMAGYFNNPQANEENFSGNWFHTGDMGYIDPEGFLHITDRKKDMIISGGINIYSKEVELAVSSHEAVSEVAVIGVPDPVWGESVKAYVVLKPNASATAEELIEHCRQRIASYKKPRSVDFVDELPKNAAGKVLKQVLRQHARSLQQKQTG